jgi:hypothetical protein
MITLDPAAMARLSAGALGACWLIELDFLQGVLRYTTYGISLDAVVGGVTYNYRGLGDALAIDQLKEGEDPRPDQLTVSLSLANAASLGAALGAVHTYRNRPMRVYLQLLDDVGAIEGAAALRYTGVMDKINVSVESDAATGTRRGRIDLVCGRKGLVRARHEEGMRLTHQQHQLLHPGDRGLEYLAAMIDKPRMWLSKRFQQQ